jgi:hypothetical protein
MSAVGASSVGSSRWRTRRICRPRASPKITSTWPAPARAGLRLRGARRRRASRVERRASRKPAGAGATLEVPDGVGDRCSRLPGPADRGAIRGPGWGARALGDWRAPGLAGARRSSIKDGTLIALDRTVVCRDWPVRDAAERPRPHQPAGVFAASARLRHGGQRQAGRAGAGGGRLVSEKQITMRPLGSRGLVWRPRTAASTRRRTIVVWPGSQPMTRASVNAAISTTTGSDEQPDAGTRGRSDDCRDPPRAASGRVLVAGDHVSGGDVMTVVTAVASMAAARHHDRAHDFRATDVLAPWA